MNTAAPVMNEQLSRIALLYVLATFAACVSLMSVFLPWWLLPAATVCAAWRFLIFTGRVSFPALWIKLPLLLLALTAMFIQYGMSISLDIFVMLLLLGFSLKLLELYHCRDARLLLYLAFFVLATAFLFNQTPGMACLVFLVVVLVLSAMVAVQSTDNVLQLFWFQPLRKAVTTVALALPVMAFMFVVMPRVPPLWSMPLQIQHHAKTGMSDSMDPGEIAELAQSSELVFRATFTGGAIPVSHDLYWYGIILDQFDGRRWTESCTDCSGQWRDTGLTPRNTGTGSHYQVILEPHGYRWLYTLMPSHINDSSVVINSDNIFRYKNDIVERQVYEADYFQPKPVGVLTGLERARYLALPVNTNPQSTALAGQWRRDAVKDGLDNDVDKIIVKKSLDFYGKNFIYTLQPPLLGEQRIDDFLFNTRRGFCEHFASSFVFLMRAAGIPARVVLGYMGGEINTDNHYVVVRQYDAHAWAEVWLAEKGWTRVDPTAVVAPERIEMGFASAYSGNKDFTLNGLAAYRHIAWLNNFRLELDRLDYMWARWVLGYEGEQQQRLLAKLGLLSPLRIAVWGGGSMALVFIALCIYLYWRDWWVSHEPLPVRRYRQLCRIYSILGAERSPAETPLQYAEKICSAGLPQAEKFLVLSRQYYQWCYVGNAFNKTESSNILVRKMWRLYWRLVLYWFRGRLVGRAVSKC